MADPALDFPTRLYGLDSAGEVARLMVFLAALGLFVHLAARVVLDKSDLSRALLAGTLGFLLAVLAAHLVRFDLLAIVLGLAVFATVTALVYRVRWPKGAAIGALAWLMWQVLARAAAWALRHV